MHTISLATAPVPLPRKLNPGSLQQKSWLPYLSANSKALHQTFILFVCGFFLMTADQFFLFFFFSSNCFFQNSFTFSNSRKLDFA